MAFPGTRPRTNLHPFLLQHSLKLAGDIQRFIDGIAILVFPYPKDHLSKESGQEELGSDDSFNSVGGRLSKAFTRDWNTLVLYGAGGTVFDGRAAIQNTFSLGGLFNLSGLTRDQLRGQHALLGALAFYRQIGGRSAAPPNLPIYLGLSLETGNVWENKSDITFSSLIPAGSVFLGMDTVLGPVYVAYGMAEGGHDAFYFFLGRGF